MDTSANVETISVVRKIRHGITHLYGVGDFRTDELIAKLRRFRGRKTYSEMVTALGATMSKGNWLTVRGTCVRNQIMSADPDDPEYYPSVVRKDLAALRAAERSQPKPKPESEPNTIKIARQAYTEKKLREEMEIAKRNLKEQIRLAVAEAPFVTVPYKSNDDGWV